MSRPLRFARDCRAGASLLVARAVNTLSSTATMRPSHTAPSCSRSSSTSGSSRARKVAMIPLKLAVDGAMLRVTRMKKRGPGDDPPRRGEHVRGGHAPPITHELLERQGRAKDSLVASEGRLGGRRRTNWRQAKDGLAAGEGRTGGRRRTNWRSIWWTTGGVTGSESVELVLIMAQVVCHPEPEVLAPKNVKVRVNKRLYPLRGKSPHAADMRRQVAACGRSAKAH
jgi:hypothetical protein